MFSPYCRIRSFGGQHFLWIFLRPTSIFFVTFSRLMVSFWMAINLRLLNPHSKRIWWTKLVHFDHIVVSDRFEGLYYLRRFLRSTCIFFVTFSLVKVSFWMAINLRFWNLNSERTWLATHVLFDQIVVSDHFKGLHFIYRLLRLTCIFSILSPF